MGISSRIIPFAARAEVLRLFRRVKNASDLTRLATARGIPDDFPHRLAHGESPLLRSRSHVDPVLQAGKEKNVGIAAGTIDNVLVKPGEIFSYHRLVGRPSYFRGFRKGLEMHDGEKLGAIGGGCCQISNMLYWLALNAGMRIVERHRHGLDLFPDCNRTVPFGCGATVFYNYVDLRFENPLPEAVIVRLEIRDGMLTGGIYSPSVPKHRIRIEERDHRFFEENGQRMRENRIWRIIQGHNGETTTEELIAHNRCRVMY